ncbi:hypothetical protein [Azovibrio restrictus]|uniref:hypothetical protein n=1 Tax=Azovibrio restrictus TaxID=146938 RepID=UPI0026EEABFB|nr:hypothetical protein [Azovibrio restrictus]
MKTLLLWVHRLLTALLALLSLNLIWHGANEITATMGLVQGSEFGMLITLANQMGGVRVWLGTFALWQITRPEADKKEQAS